MSAAEDSVERIDFLLKLLCDERLDDAQSAELASLLATSAVAQQRYVEIVQMCVTLADWSQPAELRMTPPGVTGQPTLIEVVIKEPVALPVGSYSERLVSVADRNTSPANMALLGRYWRPLLAVAAVLVVSAFLLSRTNVREQRGGGNRPATIADSATQGIPKDTIGKKRKSAIVGKFVAMVVELTPNAEWEEDLRPREFLMRLRAGEQLQLKSGLAHVQFYSGAHIILHGPSTFTPTGVASGKLETGRLTGKVDGGDFLLTTPAAEVIDLGTEFGVTVGALSNTDVCVFDGEVKVKPGLAGIENYESDARSYHLKQGMSVRVAATGQVSDGQQAGIESDLFTRSFPLPSDTDVTQLDLVDIICGGNGRGQRLAAAIDPLTGMWDQRAWSFPYGPGNQRGDGVYHQSSWHPFIDGVFIPNDRAPMQIDSLNRIVKLPAARGMYTWGPIWARRATKDLVGVGRRADLWGADTYPVITGRLAQARQGGIGLHASVGITFDLHAIGHQHHRLIHRLQGVLTNLDNAQEHNPKWASQNIRTADFYVLVDGKLRYEKLNLARNVVGEPFDIDLSPEDRFLTFVSTNGGDRNRYDHIVVIDPVLLVQDDPTDKLSVLLRRLDMQTANSNSKPLIYQWSKR
jgi:hypothetical protein